MDNVMSQEESLLKDLIRFYKQDQQYLNILTLIAKQKTSISLREMDYTVTNYSDKNKIIYTLKNGEQFNMYLKYKCQLRGYSKKLLDPFCRRQRIFLDYRTNTPIYLEDKEINNYKTRKDGIVTTIGQLNFFRWAIQNEIVDFCFTNKEAIDREMELVDKNKKKKKELKEKSSTSKNNSCKITKNNSDEIKVIIKFE